MQDINETQIRRWVHVKSVAGDVKIKKLVVNQHLWIRAKQHRAEFRDIKEGLSGLIGKTVPSGSWYFQLSGKGILVGRGAVVVSVLTSRMSPQGRRIK